MNKDAFWNIIENVKQATSPELEICPLLAKLSLEELVSYQHHFDQCVQDAYQWSLWGAAYIIEGGCSDDGFTDFRYGLIAKGRDVFENALIDADSLVSLGRNMSISNECFGYVAQEICEEKFGQELTRCPLEIKGEPDGESWDFENEYLTGGRLPYLYKLFW